MVVPLDLNRRRRAAPRREAAQAAARSANPASPRSCWCPDRRDLRGHRVCSATVEQVGRLADGDPGTLIRPAGRVQSMRGHAARASFARSHGPSWNAGRRPPRPGLPGHVPNRSPSTAPTRASRLAARAGARSSPDRGVRPSTTRCASPTSGYSPIDHREAEAAGPPTRARLTTSRPRSATTPTARRPPRPSRTGRPRRHRRPAAARVALPRRRPEAGTREDPGRGLPTTAMKARRGARRRAPLPASTPPRPSRACAAEAAAQEAVRPVSPATGSSREGSDPHLAGRRVLRTAV
ncbi:hypothetical protein SCYAM73S_01050 [Streptomyces cyaneofuscatus]